MDLHAMTAMQVDDLRGKFRTDDARHRIALARNHVHFELAFAQRGRGFQSNEAGPDHRHRARTLQ